MFCKNCANEMDPNAAVCVKCGVKVGDGNKFCPNCGKETMPGAAVCIHCGTQLSVPKSINSSEQKSRIAAGLLGIFLGEFGVHNFYLGNTTRGIIQIVVSVCTCFTVGYIWGLIEGILILAGSITTDANGIPLKD